ncbi:hypothetical protein PIB30_107429, partial [Stylosanthes scabra]|nr:hypothetical protein [Stylosanthes scabra]
GRRDFTKDGLSARLEGKASVQVVQAVPWTTLVMGERQLGPTVVEPGEPGILLDLPSSSFFSYEISRKREGSLLNAAFLLYTIPFAMDDTLQRDKNLFLFQSFEESSLLNTCKSDEV